MKSKHRKTENPQTKTQWITTILPGAVIVLGVAVAFYGCTELNAATKETVDDFAYEKELPGFKMLALFNKREDITWEEYERMYLVDHAPLIEAIPNIRGWVVNIVQHGEEPSPYDGIGEFWFDDPESFGDAMASDETAAALKDAEKFVAPPGPQIIIVSEHVMISPQMQ